MSRFHQLSVVRNEGSLLPLAKSGLKIALIGPDAALPYVSGQGSGSVPTSNTLVSPLAAFQARGVVAEYDNGANIKSAVDLARDSDVAIVFGSAHSGEGHDRKDLNFRCVLCSLSFFFFDC